jgi:hypothetical protein
MKRLYAGGLIVVCRSTPFVSKNILSNYEDTLDHWKVCKCTNSYIFAYHSQVDVITTIGYLKGAPRLDIYGFNVYHKNRLILVNF